jgi:hypothetical protein
VVYGLVKVPGSSPCFLWLVFLVVGGVHWQFRRCGYFRGVSVLFSLVWLSACVVFSVAWFSQR